MKTEIGQQLWEVEWCSKVVREDNGDLSPDACEYSVRRFTDKTKANKFAGEIYPRDGFGSVRITPVVAVDDFGVGRVTSYEANGDSVFYEGERPNDPSSATRLGEG